MSAFSGICNPNWSVIYGTYRASTFKRQSETLKNNIPEREKLISNSLITLSDIFKDKEYPILACIEAKKILKEFDYVINNPNYSCSLVGKYVSFIANHYFNIISRLRGESIESKESKELLSKVYNADLKTNPLHSVEWYSIDTHVVYDSEHIEELREDGYEIVEVYSIPEKDNGLSNFIFGRDEIDREFFLVVSNYESGWLGWADIQIGTKLAVQYESLSKTEKATFATEILDIDQYVI